MSPSTENRKSKIENQELDLLHIPLSGVNLIEASAGTGKTYAIEGLFLRLILEELIPVEEILVVTFTNAATEELKDRIRGRLAGTREAFSGKPCGDFFIDTLVKRSRDRQQSQRAVHNALIDFDRASIFTIHGFCQRLLHDHAFETGSLFDTELITDPSDLFREVADDFWRKRFYRCPAELVSYALTAAGIGGPEYFHQLLSRMTSPDMTVIPAPVAVEITGLGPYRETLRRLRSIWPSGREEIRSVLSDPDLNGTIYGSVKSVSGPDGPSRRALKVEALLGAMDRLVGPESIGFPPFEELGRLTASGVRRAVRKGKTAPEHPVLDLCETLHTGAEALKREMERYLLSLKAELFSFASEEIAVRKKTRNIHFFDDLLLQVRKALNPLADAVRGKYRAALVDEFQDTDSIQYEIFSGIFSPARSVLFMIGDPKQSIYGFRGADIFTYMTAAGRAENRFTLSENWRSAPRLIHAVNTVFSGVARPFAFEKISFDKARPPGGRDPEEGGDSSPLRLWFLPGQDGKPVNKGDAVPLIAREVAEEAVRILSDSGGSLRPGDLAILVRTNRQALVVKECLAQKGIPSVLFHTGNVFDSREALEMERVLSAVAEPGNHRRLRAALATDMMGVRGEELDFQEELSRVWERRLSDFREYSRIWSRHGFIRMFRSLMAGQGVRARLLCLADGERRLTNVMHLAEILHEASAEGHRGPESLLRWLQDRRSQASRERETHLLRLESDSEAVKIVTIHKSKGLQYEVVFCPFLWEGSQVREEGFVFHGDQETPHPVLDLGSEEKEKNRVLARNETLAEDLRLLYVALTRARKRCYLVWGNIRDADSSPLAYLFHCPQTTDGRDWTGALAACYSEKTQEKILSDLRRLEERSGKTIALSVLPSSPSGSWKPEIKEEILTVRKFSGTIDTAWRVSSYSALVSARSSEEEYPDRDAAGLFRPAGIPAGGPADPANILSFPGGARSGTFFHEILERVDFAGKPEDHALVVRDRLAEYGFDPAWEKGIMGMLEKVLSVPLDGESLLLSGIDRKDRISEMSFYFPIKSFSPGDLQRVFSHRGGVPAGFPEDLGNLVFSPSRGFMKGFIDLVFHKEGRFYLVDWKSNHLGDRLEDYGGQALSDAMVRGFYILQYYLYAVALNRYLQNRMPGYAYDRNFGGVFYVFIRGVDPGRGAGYGIYRDLPDREVVEALDKMLIEEQ